MSNKVIVELNYYRPVYVNGRQIPDYHAIIQRRLHGLTLCEGKVIQWKLGNRIIHKNTTDIEICIERPPKREYTNDIYVTSLVEIINHSFMNSTAYKTLDIPIVKSVLIHGASGVGKTTLIRHVAESLSCILYELSIYDLLQFKEEEYSSPEFVNYNPLCLMMNKAAHTTPSIIILRDLNALGSVGKDKASKLIHIISTEINRIDDHKQICVIGLAHQLSSLPDAFKRTDIFRQHMALPIPTMTQRKSLLKEMMKVLDLDEQTVEKYSTQISLRTSGYVARDLKSLIRQAMLKSKRRKAAKEEDIVNRLEQLSISSDIQWEDFEYAIQVHRPSQQLEQEATMPKRDWSELGGYKEIKDRMKQAILLPLREPHVFTKLGIRPPSGLLLHGPSGTGKTALVQALITESMMNVISIKGPEIFSKYLGETEEKIRTIFATAKRISPCIIFIDEMDAIGTKRGLNDISGGVNERVLSTLLNEMDGVEGRQGVVVIGCTNRLDHIDDAILRPGRLDQLILVDLPTLEERIEIIKAYMHRIAVADDVDPVTLAYQTESCTGADIENLFREAGTLALRKDMNAQRITMQDILQAHTALNMPKITK
ncbi:unnamed protein product [Rhizopus microsporus]